MPLIHCDRNVTTAPSHYYVRLAISNGDEVSVSHKDLSTVWGANTIIYLQWGMSFRPNRETPLN